MKSSEIILVMGMHRSGTSMVTNIITEAGYYCGEEDDLMHPSFENEKGYFERVSIAQCNDIILQLAGGTWDNPPSMDNIRQIRIDPFLYSLLDCYRDKARSVLKDPRMCLTFPVWERVIDQKIRMVYVKRNEDAVIKSLLKNRNNLNNNAPEFLRHLYKIYNLAVESYLKKYEHLILQYEDFFNEKRKQVVAELGKFIRAGVDFEEIVNNVVSFSLNHSLDKQAFEEATSAKTGLIDSDNLTTKITPPLPSLTTIEKRMKEDWNNRALEDARYYVRSVSFNQDEKEFDESGRINVEQFILSDRNIIHPEINPKEQRVLEIGCGLGRLTRHLAEIFGEVHGIDVSGEMIRQAKARLSGKKNVFLYETNGSDLSIFKDDTFDLVFSYIVFQHIPSKEIIFNYIREAGRVLKQNGIFKFQVQGSLDPNFRKIKKDTWHGEVILKDDILNLCQSYGFDFIDNSGEGTQYSWYTLKWTGHTGNQKIDSYSEKLAKEIAIYENNTQVHNLPEIHNFFSRKFLVPALETLTGKGDWLEYWQKEIDDFVTRLNRPVTMISLACGNGDVEIALIKRLKTKDQISFIGFDVNPRMIERGRQLAKAQNLPNVQFQTMDLNYPDFASSIDIVLANHSLHHLVELEKLFQEINHKSSPEMIFLINDMIGRNGHMMWPNTEQVLIQIWKRLDNKYKLNAYSKRFDDRPFNYDCSKDGFEGIRAQDILPLLIQYFDIEMFLPFSTIMNRFVDRVYGHNFNVNDPKDQKLISALLDLDNEFLQTKKLSPTQAFIRAQRKGTVNRLRYLYQKPEEAIEARRYALKIEDYIQKIDQIFPSDNQITEQKHDLSLVSIIIPVYNNLAYTHKCLLSVFQNTQYPSYEIIIINNASTDGTFEYLQKLQKSNVKTIHNTDNLGFVKACNQGARIASGKYIMLLNNDTEVQPGWLKSLVEFIENHLDCGAVGSKLIYPDKTLQEAGAIIFSNGEGWNFGRGLNPNDPRFNFVREVDYCSGAALMVRKDLWDRYGGLDEQFAPAYYEDTDLCFGIRRLGYKVYYQPASHIIHYEGKTAGTDINSGFKKYQVVNREKFQKKWQDELTKQYAHDVRNVVMASNRAVRKNLFVSDPLIIKYDRASGSLRLFTYLKILKELGFHITFIARIGSTELRYRHQLQQEGIEVYENDIKALEWEGFDVNTKDIDHTLCPNHDRIFSDRRYDYAIISFWYLGRYYIPLIREKSPDTTIILDSVDIHFVRELREAEIKKDEKLKKKAEYLKPKELTVYNKADRVWVVTEQDKKSIESNVRNIPIDIIPNIHLVSSEAPDFDKSRDLLFVGNFAHPPNVDAVDYFIKEIWPGVSQKIPDIRLWIVGNNPPDHIKKLHSEKIIVTGFVPETKPYLLQSRISVNPLRYGAGMKGKIGEALSFGLPVITTSIGAEGMNLEDNKHALIADSPDTFINQIVRLYNDRELWQKLSAAGRAHVENNWGKTPVIKKFKKIFDLNGNTVTSDLPLVSIIMLTWNALEYTKKCVASIEANTEIPYEIIFVDNGSKDGTKKYLKSLVKENPNYKLINNSKNMGFAAGNNQGVKKAGGEYVLILNNDVLVGEGWLDSLLQSIQKDEKIGIVGPITNSISGLQMVNNIPYEGDDFIEFAGKVRQVNAGKLTPRRRLAGFAMLMKKSLYQEIGGFDESFAAGNFEDDDLCLRVKEKGYAMMVDESTFIHHYGSQTFKANKIDYSASLQEKGKYFREKWPGVDYEELLELKNPLSLVHEQLAAEALQHLQENRLQQAGEIYQQILNDNPLSREALYGYGIVLMNQEHYDEALLNFNRLIRHYPSDAQAYNQIGVLFKLKEDYEAAKASFTLAIQKDPSLIDAQRNYGDILIEMADYENGIRVFYKILENHPDDIPSLIYMANLCLEAERFSDAERYLQLVLNREPHNDLANQLKDILLQTVKDKTPDSAAQVMNTVSQESIDGLITRANTNLEHGQLDQAVRDYEHVLKENPSCIEALYGLGLVERMRENWAKATEYFQKIIKHEPNFSPAYTNLGGITYACKNFHEAYQWLVKALTLSPYDLETRHLLTEVLIELGRFEEAIQLIMDTLRENPGDVPTLIMVGKLHYEAGKKQESRNYFEQAIRLEPQNEVAQYFLQTIES